MIYLTEYRLESVAETAVKSARAESPEQIHKLWKAAVIPAAWYRPEQECLVVFFLNARLKVKGFSLVSLGLINSVQIGVREVFRAAIVNAAHSIILAHNHPSGDARPSEDDLYVTRKICKAGAILGIEVKDHLIIGHGRGRPGFISLRAAGQIFV